MRVQELAIPAIKVLTPARLRDGRGFLSDFYCQVRDPGRYGEYLMRLAGEARRRDREAGGHPPMPGSS